MADSASAEIYAALRAASRPTKERYLVGVTVASERAIILSALSAEGEVETLSSVEAAIKRLANESFDLVVLDEEDTHAHVDAFVAAREIRPRTEIVPVLTAHPTSVGRLFSLEAPAVLLRPFPNSEALLRAHIRYLASCRRARTRASALRYTIVRHRAQLQACEPELEAALTLVLEQETRAPSVWIQGGSELHQVIGPETRDTAPDLIVVELRAEDRVELRLREARGRTVGAVFVVVDAAPSPERLNAAIYAGVRAYLPLDAIDPLGRIVAIAASRRRAEVTGRHLVETLTRFGVMEEPHRSLSPVIQDLDAQLIANATSSGSLAMVPSPHEVLIVDDEIVVLTVLREILRRSGYPVTTAASAEEAIMLMKSRSFDLVLTDKNLPGASGLEVLRVARSLVPPPAVVLITGYSSYDSAAIALDIGAQDYIEKPIRDVDALLFRIRRAISRRNEQIQQAHEPGEANPTRGRILVVELEASRRRLLTEFLGRNYDVVGAANGDEALAVLKSERFDLVLADRNLPGMSGLRVIEQAQKLLPHCASVLYTAYPSYETVKEAFDLGVDAYLVHPSEDLTTLATKVAGALRNRGGILLG
jgi:CheY-like chemotaxis protein